MEDTTGAKEQLRGATVEKTEDEDTTGAKTQPRGVTVEDEERLNLPLFPQSDANSTGSWHNRLDTDVQDGGEPDKSQLGTPVLQAPPFPIPRDFPRVNESTPSASSPSFCLQRRCPICFSTSKPNLLNSACVSGLANLYVRTNLYPPQSPGHSLHRCQLCPTKAAFSPSRSGGPAPR